MPQLAAPQDSAVAQKAAKPAAPAQPSPFIKQNFKESTIREVRGFLLSQGFRKERVDKLLSDGRLERNKEVARKFFRQPEEAKSYEEYRAMFDIGWLVKKGAEFYKKHRKTFAAAENEEGRAPRELVLAVLGHESNYGKNPGDFTLVNAFLTIYESAKGPRAKEFASNELADMLRLCIKCKKDAFEVKGSYGGAVGPMQFMFSTLMRFERNGWLEGVKSFEQLTSEPVAIRLAARYLAEAGADLSGDFRKYNCNWTAALKYRGGKSENYPDFVCEIAARIKAAIAEGVQN